MRKALLATALGATTALVAATAGDARACGGYFPPPPPPNQSGTVATDHRMIFAVSPTQTTLYDQIQYQGSPASFAWVLPIHGTVTVALSSDILFQAIDQATTTTIVAPQLPVCPSCNCANGPTANAGFASGGGSSSSGGSVTVLEQQVVGPYETVQLSSTDPTSLTTWLTANGYDIPTSAGNVIGAYVNAKFDFLAMKLLPGAGVQEMRPVSVTTTGAGSTLPLRMVAAGTGSTVGITLWVVATARYEPMNFPTFTISGSDLTWDWSAPGPSGQGDSDYATIQASKEAALSDAAWQIESSLSLSPFQIENTVLADPATQDYLAVQPGQDGGANDGGLTGTPATADQVRQQDLGTCFPEGSGTEVRVTRMRADLSQAALANDLVLQPSPDQTVMSNIYDVTKSINAPACPVIDQSTCGCLPGSSSGGSSGVSGAPTTSGASPGQQSFSCSTGPSDSSGGGLALAVAGLLGAALVGARSRRKR